VAIADDQPASTTPSTPSAPATEQKMAPATGTTTTHSSSHHHHKHVVDLNSAAKEDLTKLPGITDDIADKIIAARPFKSKSELTSKKILTKTEYNKVSASVTAKTTATASK
jgi:DNA uptake protein ComE-like DNA-binding protein